ncbi:hypothetical protein C8R47DRAFT_403394 [Mycena vitilis]|nr:hypothetical protein C8R47DRAFT_403394 [Mycena vitilis]
MSFKVPPSSEPQLDSLAEGSLPDSHGHVLSKKSRDLQRDTFFFAPNGPYPTRLILALNQRSTPMSMVKLRRWALLISGRDTDPESYPPLVFFICPVTMKSTAAMAYSISPCGPIVDPDSDEPLPPGNYGWYKNRELTNTGFEDLEGVDAAMVNKSFEFNVTYMTAPRMLDSYKFPPDVTQVVMARDRQRCRVTGSTDNIMLTWIVPPPWAWAAVDVGNPEDLDPAPYRVAANALTMRADFKVHFYNHNFAVDVDDEYRIVVLRDMGADHALLPTHLPGHPVQPGADAEFFRLHLRYSLNFMVLGGDIGDTYPPGLVLAKMEELGVRGEDYDMVPLTDERWQTELGKAIFAEHMRYRAALSSHEYSDDESDDDESDVKEPDIEGFPRVRDKFGHDIITLPPDVWDRMFKSFMRPGDVRC